MTNTIVNTNMTTTKNGMATMVSSLKNTVDLFFAIGASRGKDILPAFNKAMSEDKDLALRIALWSRDVRGGAGERQIFRDIITHLAQKDQASAERLLPLIPEMGRWDDLTVLFGTSLENKALKMIVSALNDGNGLCAKWMDRKGPNANKIRAYMKLTPKAYRKLLVGLTNVVETKMCAKEWDTIEFSKIPSLASARYQGAFSRNAADAYAKYKAGLEKGTEKVNAGAVYPYDVVKSLAKGDEVVANAQWASLPNYLEGSDASILPVVDVSGSMNSPVGGSKELTCMNVAVSLGLYLSERAEGIFKNSFITFSESPQLQTVNGSLSERYEQMITSKWGMSTNLESSFSLLLDQAVKHKLPADKMPKYLLILSDMQFNSACRQSDTAMNMIEGKYAKAGYDMPNVIFWNLADHGGSPVTFDKRGTALVSGFSPSLMKSILRAENVTPVDIMMQTIMDERYNC